MGLGGPGNFGECGGARWEAHRGPVAFPKHFFSGGSDPGMHPACFGREPFWKVFIKAERPETQQRRFQPVPVFTEQAPFETFEVKN